jgi:plastocyanin
MSRALAAAGLALALIASFALAPEVAPTGGDRAAAADCTWQRHPRRIVRHVKRHGRTRKIVRTANRWTCEPLAQPPAVGIPPASLPGPAPAPSPEVEPPPRAVSATVDDETPEAFSFTLSRHYVVSGNVTVELNNRAGQDAHNLKVRPKGSEDDGLEVGEAGSGESRVAHLELAPGTYQLYCSLPRHEEWGMSVDLEVRAG